MSYLYFAFIALSLPYLLALRARYRLRQLRCSVVDSWSLLETRLRARYELITQLLPLMQRLDGAEPAQLHRYLQAIERNREQAAEYMRLFDSAGGPMVTGMAPLLEAESRMAHELQGLFEWLDRGDVIDDEHILQPLRRQISASETQVAFTRLGYNDAAMYYNLAQRGWPGQWMAEWGDHTPVDLYRIDAPPSR